MKPVSSNVNNYPSKKGCTPVNASCIVWEGPNIPCIDLCKGDTIDKVVYDLAKILCDVTDNLLDVTSLDFECLLENGGCEPKTILETLQLLISKACKQDEAIVQDIYQEPVLPLPSCLYYTNGEGDDVTELVLSEYVTYLADKICEILLSIASINVAITNINERIDELEILIGESIRPGSLTINVVSRCLSAPSPGTTLNIATAFGNLEQALCDYIAVVGELSEWQAMLSKICIDSTTPLPCDISGATTYGDLANWINNPTTAAGAVNNLWVALCAMNTCISEITNPTLTCGIISPSNVTVTPGNITATINWVAAPIPVGYEPVNSYEIGIYDATGTSLVNSYTGISGSATSYTVTSGAPLVAGTDYVVKVSAVYSCGQSPFSNAESPVGEIITIFVTNQIAYSTVDTIVPDTCLGVGYNKIEREITIELQNLSGVPAVYPGGDIILTFELENAICPPAAPIVTTFDITITAGSSTGTYTFDASREIDCSGGVGPCTAVSSTVTCLSNVDNGGLTGLIMDGSVPPEC